MAGGLPANAHLRARRWDVLILGSALPGLAAAVRLGMAGLRVLVAEEDAAARTPALVREPFFMPGGPVLDACLKALGLPLVQRRSLEPEDLAYQVLLPDARVDVGVPRLALDEWIAWGLAKPDDATRALDEINQTGSAIDEELLGQDLARKASRIARGGAGSVPVLSAAYAANPETLGPFIRAQEVVLGRRIDPEGVDAVTARILANAAYGGARFRDASLTLRSILRRRIETLHGEVRTIGCPFGMVELGDASGIARIGPDDAWLGRALVLNAPAHRIGAKLAEWEQAVPALLDAPVHTHRRLAVHVRALREVMPEPLAARAILSDGNDAPIEIAQHPSGQGSRFVELVLARTVAADADDEAETARMLEATAELIPYEAGRAKLAPIPARPGWDDDSIHERSAGAWPAAITTQPSSRRPIFTLRRGDVAPLGVEGELLLGWRTGDAIRETLA